MSASGWTVEEDKKLLVALEKYGVLKWEQVAKEIGTKNASQAKNHFTQIYPQVPTDLPLVGQTADVLRHEVHAEAADGVLGVEPLSARWVSRVKTDKTIPAGTKVNIPLPHSWNEETIAAYIAGKHYRNEFVTVFTLSLALVARVGGQVIVSDIPIFNFGG